MSDLNQVDKAAILLNGKVYTVPRPLRHHNLIRKLVQEGHPKPIIGEQGFVLNDGTFVSRERAAIIALEANQCCKLISPPRLYSEDLW